MNARPRANAGFSLIELMVTVAVAAILLAVALPNLRSFMRRNAVTSETNDLIADLQLARSTAVSRRVLVAFCPLATTSTVACDAASATYENGWLIYIVTTPGAKYTGAGTLADTNLLRMATKTTSVSIRTASATPITFNQRGEISNGSDVAFNVCSTAGSAALGTSVNGAQGVVLTQASSGRAGTAPIAVGGTCS